MLVQVGSENVVIRRILCFLKLHLQLRLTISLLLARHTVSSRNEYVVQAQTDWSVYLQHFFQEVTILSV